jgi:hypothetical protein
MLLPSSSTKTTLAKRASSPLLIAIDEDSNDDSDIAMDSFVHNPIRQTSRQKRPTLKAAEEMQK